MARPLRKSAGVRGDNHRHVRISVETAVIRPATENVRPRLVKGDPDPPGPSSGTGEGRHKGTRGEFAPVRVSSHTFTLGVSKVTLPSPR